MAFTYEPIATNTLSVDSNSITFSSLSGYTDIVAVLFVRSTTASNYSDNYLRLATGGGSVDTGNNYSTTRLYGDGTSALSNRASINNYIVCGTVPGTPGDANTFATVIVNFQNYSNSTTNKTVLTRAAGIANAASNPKYAMTDVGLWRNTGAITSIQFVTNGNYKAGSTFALYGIKAA